MKTKVYFLLLYLFVINMKLVNTLLIYFLFQYIVRSRLPMNTFIHSGVGAVTHTHIWFQEIHGSKSLTMKHGCSRFLTTLAQFHSNRSRLIHGVQFNPFSRLDRRRGRPMEKHRSYRGPPRLPSVQNPSPLGIEHGRFPYTDPLYIF